LGQIGFDDLSQEVADFWFFGGCRGGVFGHAGILGGCRNRLTFLLGLGFLLAILVGA